MCENFYPSVREEETGHFTPRNSSQMYARTIGALQLSHFHTDIECAELSYVLQLYDGSCLFH